MLICGIDPGLDGGIAIIDGNNLELLETIPTKGKTGFIKRQVDGTELARILRPFDCEIWIESVASRPGQGVASVFSFGDTYGCIRGVLEALNFKVNTVAPKTWKTALNVSSKEDSLKAIKLSLLGRELKLLKKDHNLAEAMLIALYGQRMRVENE